VKTKQTNTENPKKFDLKLETLEMQLENVKMASKCGKKQTNAEICSKFEGQHAACINPM